MRLASTYRMSSSPDPLFLQVSIVCWSQAELAYSLSTMTVPCLMPIMSKLDTNLGALDRQTIAASDSGPYGVTQSKSRLRSAIKRNSQHMPLGSEVCLTFHLLSHFPFLGFTEANVVCVIPRFVWTMFTQVRSSEVRRRIIEASTAMIAPRLLSRSRWMSHMRIIHSSLVEDD